MYPVGKDGHIKVAWIFIGNFEKNPQNKSLSGVTNIPVTLILEFPLGNVCIRKCRTYMFYQFSFVGHGFDVAAT